MTTYVLNLTGQYPMYECAGNKWVVFSPRQPVDTLKTVITKDNLMVFLADEAKVNIHSWSNEFYNEDVLISTREIILHLQRLKCKVTPYV